MEFYCLEEFKKQYLKLISKKSYQELEKETIEYFSNKNIDELKAGTRLNNSNETPYIKKRISGSGGYRFYFLLLIKKEKLYFMFVHPKTGSLGAENITDLAKKELQDRVYTAIKFNNLYKVVFKENKIAFEHLNKKIQR